MQICRSARRWGPSDSERRDRCSAVELVKEEVRKAGRRNEEGVADATVVGGEAAEDKDGPARERKKG